MENKETRNLEVIEIRADSESRNIEGYAAIWETWSNDLGGFREKIRRGAFRQSIRSDRIYATWQHDTSRILARRNAGKGTLQLREDENGLEFRFEAPDTTLGNDTLVMVERGDIDSMSFGFIAQKDEWNREGEDGMAERTLVQARLVDIGLVSFPAYPDTSVAVRSLESLREEVDAGDGETLAIARQRGLEVLEREIEAYGYVVGE